MPQTTAINLANPIHSVSAALVIQGLAKKGRTIDTLKEKPTVRFTKEELNRLSTLKKPENIITNQFANQVVQSVLNRNPIALAIFRSAQLKFQGLTGTIHGNKPAVIDLESLDMYYCGANNIEAKIINYNEATAVKPEDIKAGIDHMPLAFRWGVTRSADDKLYCTYYGNSQFIPNQEFNKWLVYSPALLSNTLPTSKPEEVEKLVEMDGLVLKGKDGGKKLEISTKTPFIGTKEIKLPFFVQSLGQVEPVPFKINYKKR